MKRTREDIYMGPQPKGSLVSSQGEDLGQPQIPGGGVLNITDEFEEAINFINKIKMRFQNDNQVFYAFLRSLHMYRVEKKSITEVYQKVATLFQDHVDLLQEFKLFLPDSFATGPIQQAPPDRGSILHLDEQNSDMPMLRQMHGDKRTTASNADRDLSGDPADPDNRDTSKMKHLPHKQKSAHRLEYSFVDQLNQEDRNKVQDDRETIRDCEREKDQEKERPNEIVNWDIAKVSALPKKEKCMSKPISELDLSCCQWSEGCLPKSVKAENGNKAQDDRENVRDMANEIVHRDMAKVSVFPNKEKSNPSYRLLPKNYLTPSVSHRTEVDDQVLNDRWVQVTLGSEDYSFKHMHKGQYEESLSKCEDDRFELDMLLESMKSTIENMEKLSEKINSSNTSKPDTPFHIEDHLTGLNLRCIELLYGDHGLEVLDALRNNVSIALPVILTRLKQKREEWTMCRPDFNKAWAEIYAKKQSQIA